MSRIGFVGLGVMGLPMATNLVASGFQVIGYNRSRARIDALVKQGGHAAASIGDAVRGSDVVITMLPASADVEQVVTGDDGVLAHCHPGQLLIDMSTIDPNTSRRLVDLAAAVDVRVMDAPVSGGESGAIEGSLSIMVGGTAEDFAAAEPVLNAMGRTVVHVGPHGAGQTVKAANQLMVAGQLQLLAEAIVFLRAHGVELAGALRVIGGGLAGSTVLDRKAAAMVNHDFTPGGRLALHHKDLAIVTAAARETGTFIPLGSAVAGLVGALVARGDGDLDHSALLKLVEDLSRPLA
jgi:2-hydroxy-3-oxopropionate reductase